MGRTSTQSQNWGGKRVGSGRKKGSGMLPSTKVREMLKDYIMPAKRIELIQLALRKSEDNADILKFLLEQIWGKARQNIGIGNEEQGKALIVQISEVIAQKNGLK